MQNSSALLEGSGYVLLPALPEVRKQRVLMFVKALLGPRQPGDHTLQLAFTLRPRMNNIDLVSPDSVSDHS